MEEPAALSYRHQIRQVKTTKQPQIEATQTQPIENEFPKREIRNPYFDRMVRTWCYPDFLRKRIPSPNPDHLTFQEQLEYIEASFHFEYETAYEILLELISSARNEEIETFPPSRHCVTVTTGYIFLQYRYLNSPIQSIEIRYQHST